MIRCARAITWVLWVATMSLGSCSALALTDDFLQAQPRVKLYMAYAEYKMANYKLAHDMWQHISGAGESEALFNLGILYEQGKGVTAKLDTARDYYLAAAKKGSRAAAYQVGLMSLEHPQLVNVDVAKHWLMVAALDGDTDAGELLNVLLNQSGAQVDPLLSVKRLLMRGENHKALAQLKQLSQQEPPNYSAVTELAWLYETGLAVERDLNKAAELFTQAASAGFPKAQYALSVMYLTGVGKPKDIKQSQYWLRLAAENGYQPAIENLN